MRKHLPFIIFFFSFIVTGIFIYDDYGISWDEVDCRLDNGILNANFISSGNKKPLLESVSKYHGASFEMFLVAIERIAGLQSSKEIFLMRHLVTFLLFALSVFFFYLLCLKAFRSQWYALTACLILVLTPRIFADSFYNSKDLSFLSLFIISVYTLVNLIENKNKWNAFFAAFVAGIMIDIRIMGIILPAFTLFYLSIEFLLFKEQRRLILISSTTFIIALICSIILFWPVLWLNPIKHFILAWNENSKYPWGGSVLFDGSIIKADKLPWNYIPVWIIITTPPLYLALFVMGLFVLIKKIFSRTMNNLVEIVSVFLVVVPLPAIILLHSVLYDGWRHLFFIYPFIVIIAVVGIKTIFNLIKDKHKNYFAATIAAYLASVLFAMAEIHPFENVYFNFLANKSDSPIRERYEAEYWGLSYKQAFEYILKNDTSSQIIISFAKGQPAPDNILLLDNEQRSRITLTSFVELADYYLTCHRFDKEIKEYKTVHRIMAGDIIVHSIYKVKENKLSLNQSSLISSYVNNYETIPEQFSPTKVIVDSSDGKGNHCEQVMKENDFGAGFNFDPRKQLTINPAVKRYMRFSLNANSSIPFRSNIIIQVDSGSTTYCWNNYVIMNNSFTNRWNNFIYIWEVPEIYSSSQTYKVLLHNVEKANFKIDNCEIDFFEIDTMTINKTLRLMPI